MQMLATFDTAGKPNGFYCTEIHGENIPVDAVEISGEDYRAYVDGPGQWVCSSGARVASPPPPAPTLEQVQAIKSAEIRNEGALRLEWIASPYQAQERDTWASQLSEAEAFLIDNTASTPILSAIAEGREITKSELVILVIDNANLFRMASGAVLGEQQRLLAQVAAATTPAEVDAIVWG
jgi:hypothetical protein